MAQTVNNRSGDMLVEGVNSYVFDRRLFDADVRVRFAHSDALFHAGILTRFETERIKNGLHAILKRAGYDKNYFSELPVADVHVFAETRLVQLIGEIGLKLNVGSTRGDHAATVLRLWLREEIENITSLARVLQTELVDSAERQREAVLPALDLFGTMQPMLWAHWCLAVFERLARDRERLDEVWRRVNVMPLGSGDAAGTNFEIDREQTARDLNFEGVSQNSLDAVSDGDFAIEFVAAAALLTTHLARFADDINVLASEEFRFVEFTAEYNPRFLLEKFGALKFLRSKATRVLGHQTALGLMFKSALTISVADLNEIKESVFDTADTVKISLQTATAILSNLRINEQKTRTAAAGHYAIAASELFDYLLHKNVAYKVAAETVEKILNSAAQNGKQLNELSLAELQRFSAQIERDVFTVFDLEQMLSGKSQIGGTAPERVYEALTAARAALEMERR